jgi:hypothetical protein
VSTGTVSQPVQRRLGSGSPGLGGYVLAVVVSALMIGLLRAELAFVQNAVNGDLSAETLMIYPAGALIYAGYAFVYGLPAAVAGCVLVHMCCLTVTEQAAHVALAGVMGAVAGWVYDLALFDGFDPWLWLQLGVATTVGRAAVIPLALRSRSA